MHDGHKLRRFFFSDASWRLSVSIFVVDLIHTYASRLISTTVYTCTCILDDGRFSVLSCIGIICFTHDVIYLAHSTCCILCYDLCNMSPAADCVLMSLH